MKPSTANYPNNILENIDNLIHDIEAEIQQLPVNHAVKAQLTLQAYEVWSNVVDAMDLPPTDWN